MVNSRRPPPRGYAEILMSHSLATEDVPTGDIPHLPVYTKVLSADRTYVFDKQRVAR